MTTVISGDTGVSQVQAGSINQDDLASPAYLPKPQTWQHPARALGTTYTNSTSLPINVIVTLTQSGANANVTATVGGTILDLVTTVAGSYGRLAFVVPAGVNYVVSTAAGVTLNTWAELR